MAIPSGSGTETLRNGGWSTQSTDVTSFDFSAGNPSLGDETDTVPANHIITVVLITWCETNEAAEQIHLWYRDGVGGGQGYLIVHQDLAAFDTFIWNTKFVLIGADWLKTATENAADIDVTYTYLDQDWS